MANQKQLKHIRRSVSDWNVWRRLNRSVKIDLSNANLKKANLVGASLGKANLNKTNFSGANLREASLHMSNLKNVNLSEANLIDCRFDKSDLRGANLERVILDNSSFDSSNLGGVKLREAILNNVNLSNAKLSKADLKEIVFSDVNLHGVDFSQADLTGASFGNSQPWYANFHRADLSRAYLHKVDLSFSKMSRAIFRDADLSGANLTKANLAGVDLSGADLSEANLDGANLSGAILCKTDFSSANLRGVNLSKADLRGALLRNADLGGIDLSGADLRYADLNFSNLTHAKIDKADISGSKIYGVNVWELDGKFKGQNDLVITPEKDTVITVDNIKVAQFVYLILNNKEIRDAINTIASKTVLILGRFSIPERKIILDALRSKLRQYGLLPIVFDFDRSVDRDFTETIKTLAGLSYFVIADVTNPKSSPLELQATIPDYQIPFVPIIQEGEKPFAMMVDLQKKYNWVLKTITYDSTETLIKVLKPLIIGPAMKKRQELRLIKAYEPEIISAKDFLKKGKV